MADQKGPHMRHILMTSVFMAATLASASASDRYPVTKRFVNQTGEVVAMRRLPMSYAAVSHQHGLPAIQIVPVTVEPVRVKRSVRSAPAYNASRDSLLGTVNDDPQSWPSGRTCCRPGEPYFNENPNS